MASQAPQLLHIQVVGQGVVAEALHKFHVGLHVMPLAPVVADMHANRDRAHDHNVQGLLRRAQHVRTQLKVRARAQGANP